MTPITSRRAVLAGAAAILPALALPALAAPVDNGTDAELIELGNRLEPLLAAYMTATFEWAPLARAAGRELEAHPKFVAWSAAPVQRSQIRLMNAIHKRNGTAAADNRMTALFNEMEPIAERITATPASTLAGLRAKILVVLFEARPGSADHSGELEMADDGGASRSLLIAAAELTGLAPMVREIEARLAADAAASQAVQS